MMKLSNINEGRFRLKSNTTEFTPRLVHVSSSCNSCYYNAARQDYLKNHLFDIIVTTSQNEQKTINLKTSKKSSSLAELGPAQPQLVSNLYCIDLDLGIVKAKLI